MTATVYFSRTRTPEKALELFGLLNAELPGKVAIKVHSGEKGNQNFLGPDFWRPTIEHVGGTLVECNTAYEGARNETERHIQLMDYHGWSRWFDVEILDAEGPDLKPIWWAHFLPPRRTFRSVQSSLLPVRRA